MVIFYDLNESEALSMWQTSTKQPEVETEAPYEDQGSTQNKNEYFSIIKKGIRSEKALTLIFFEIQYRNFILIPVYFEID